MLNQSSLPKFLFEIDSKTKMIHFKSGHSSLYVEDASKYDALALMYAYHNQSRVFDLFPEFSDTFPLNPMFFEDMGLLATLSEKYGPRIAQPWFYQQIDTKTQLSIVWDQDSPSGMTPAISLCGTHMPYHLALLAGILKRSKNSNLNIWVTPASSNYQIKIRDQSDKLFYLSDAPITDQFDRIILNLLSSNVLSPYFFLALPNSLRYLELLKFDMRANDSRYIGISLFENAFCLKVDLSARATTVRSLDGERDGVALTPEEVLKLAA